MKRIGWIFGKKRIHKHFTEAYIFKSRDPSREVINVSDTIHAADTIKEVTEELSEVMSSITRALWNQKKVGFVGEFKVA